LQEPLAPGTSWHQQQQELLYSSDHHTQQWPVQQGVDGASGTGEHYLVGNLPNSRVYPIFSCYPVK